MKAKDKNYLRALTDFISPQIKILEKELEQNISANKQLSAEVAHYAIFSNGKRLRPAFVFLFAQMNNTPISKKHYLLAQAVELIHVASLIHDDIIDDSDTRHSQLSVHKKWSLKTGILAGDFLLAKALHLLSQIENTELISLFSQSMQQLCEGELQQLYQKNEVPPLSEIVEKSKRKTAMLYVAAAKGSLMISNATEEQIKKAEEFAQNFGIAFQITDDLLSYQNDYDEKSNLSDFENKVFTPVVFFAYQKNPQILKISDAQKFKEEVLKTDALKKTNRMVSQYINRAIDSLQCFEDNRAKEVLADLTKSINERTI